MPSSLNATILCSARSSAADRAAQFVQQLLDVPPQEALGVERGDRSRTSTTPSFDRLDPELELGEGASPGLGEEPVRVKAGDLTLHLELVHVGELLDLERRGRLDPQGPASRHRDGRALLD